MNIFKGFFEIFQGLLIEHTNLERWTVGKKVQAMILYPGSNLPNSGLKFIKNQIFSLRRVFKLTDL